MNRVKGSSKKRLIWVLLFTAFSLLSGCDAGDGDDDSAPELDAFVLEPRESVVREAIEGTFTWRLDSSETSQDLEANLDVTCSLEKEGQVYVSGTYFDGGNITVGLRISVPDSFPAELPVVGVFEGQDASAGEALASLNGSLLGIGNIPFDAVDGLLILKDLDVCRGNFEVSFMMEGESTFGIKGAEFEIPLEENNL